MNSAQLLADLQTQGLARDEAETILSGAIYTYCPQVRDRMLVDEER